MFPAFNHRKLMDAFRPAPFQTGRAPRGLPLAVLFLTAMIAALPDRARADAAPQAEPASAARTNAASEELAQELRWLKAERVFITSVSKREEDPFTAAAAVSVITGEEIRRSGARSIPEALRLAPGISVAQMDANKWAVTSRGFNSRFADKLLVLVDGRSVYTPSFTGVYWDSVDYVFEDIDRIEVIRGPGGTLWGANAVNGVINIITKNSKDTEGGFISGGYGSEERGFGEFRYGTKTGEKGFLRGYLKYHNTDDLEDGFDRWDFVQGGVRGDWTFGPTRLSLTADAHYSTLRERQVIARLPAIPFTGPVISTNNETSRASGQSVMARVEHDLSDENSLQLQTYFEHEDRTSVVHDGYRSTFDVDFQHRFPLPWRQHLTYGFGYRYLPDRFRNPDPGYVNWTPTVRHWQVASGFIQDDIELVADRLRLTLGTKVEHNDFTGFEYQPSVRLSLTPNTRHTVWGAVSRAVQVPGRNYDAIHIVLPTRAAFPLTVVGNGNPDLNARELAAYELGHRWQPRQNFSIDTAIFHHHYDGIGSGQSTVDLASGTVQNFASNQGTADSYGAEIAAKWDVTDWWRLSGSYTFFKLDYHDITSSLAAEDGDPRNTVSLRSSFDLPGGFELDLWGRYVDTLASYDIPSYFDLDVRLGWHATKNIEFSVAGQNLLSPRRDEFIADRFATTLVNPVQRAVYAQVSLRF